MRKEDLAFEAPFDLKVLRNDYVHAFISWFDCIFSCCHKPIRFSTGPHSKYTHWKQTVFYLEETLTVKSGECIQGQIRCAPNAKNPRDLDIGLRYEFHGELMSIEADHEYHMC